MVPILSLWLPILLSAVAVFFVSYLLHMVLTYHRSDFKKLPDEDGIQDALRRFNIAPGDYMLPCGGGPECMKDPAFLEKMKKGPVLLVTALKPGPFNMGPALLQWFLYSILVGVFVAYVAGHALAPGAGYRQVFRFAGCTAFMAYWLAQLQDSIWYHRSWSTTWKNMVDGLIYGLLTGGVFGWLWP
jgi:hypothetical protein